MIDVDTHTAHCQMAEHINPGNHTCAGDVLARGETFSVTIYVVVSDDGGNISSSSTSLPCNVVNTLPAALSTLYRREQPTKFGAKQGKEGHQTRSARAISSERRGDSPGDKEHQE